MGIIPVFFIFIFVAGVIVFAVFSYNGEKKRIEALRNFALANGLKFDPGENESLAEKYEFLSELDEGEDRYAYNIFSGSCAGHSIQFFDYHYETHSRDSEGNRTTQDHYLSVFLLFLPRDFPELTVAHEGFFSKIGQMLGNDDIDFESAEFSKAFCVRSEDKKFAYDICNSKMIEYMLANRDLEFEIERNVLAMVSSDTLDLGMIPTQLQHLIAIRERFPEYLFNK